MKNMGVIGVGSMGINHARVYSEIANLVGVSDLNRDYLDNVQRRFHTETTTDFNELLEKDLDGVSIAVPTEHHFSIAMKAIEKGTNVLIEKPIAGTIEQGQQLIEAAEKAGVVLAVGHIERHNPVIQHTKTALENQAFGDLITMSGKRVSSFPKRIYDVGVIIDLAIHDIDVMRYINDSEVESVYALAGSKDNKDFESYASILIGFKNGISGIVEVNWLTPIKIRKIWLTCSKDYVELDYINQSLEISSAKLMQHDVADLYNLPIEYNIRNVSLVKQEPLKNELNDFIQAIDSGKRPLVDGEDGVNNLAIAEAAIKSYKEGRRVLVKEISG